MQVKEQQLEPDMEQQIGSKSGKVGKGYIRSSNLVNLYAEYIMWNAKLDESQAGVKISGRNTINNPIYADDTTLTVESEEEPKRWVKWS